MMIVIKSDLHLNDYRIYFGNKEDGVLKNLIKLILRLFLIASLFHFIFNYLSTLGNHVWMNELIFIFDDMKIIDSNKVLKIFLGTIIQWCLTFIIFFVLYNKTEKLSEIIIGDDNDENIHLSLGYESILSVGIIILCLYFIFDTLPRYIFSVSDFFITKSSNIDYDIVNYTIGRGIDMIGYSIIIASSIIGIKYNRKIVKIIVNGKKPKCAHSETVE
jgi:hypothetical protein